MNHQKYASVAMSADVMKAKKKNFLMSYIHFFKLFSISFSIAHLETSAKTNLRNGACINHVASKREGLGVKKPQIMAILQ